MLKKSILTLFLCSVLFSQNAELVRSLEPHESLRAFSQRTLGNADDWEIILRYNGFTSPDEVKANAKLVVPVGRYTVLLEKLTQTERLIKKASRLGASILAKDEVNEASQLKRNALSFKRSGELTKASDEISKAQILAQTALSKTESKRVQAITAILSEKRGSVQTKRSKDIKWAEAIVTQQLVEKERIRTMRESYGQILLVDGSAISLGESSLAVIETMKENVITKEKNSNIVILEGDISSTLSALSKRNTINVEVPGLQTDIRSTSFWASRDKNKVVRIANYNGQIDLKASGSSVTLKENEGSKIVPGQAPSIPKVLLESPELLDPFNRSLVSISTVDLKWTPVENAVAYQLQIATDKKFNSLVVNQTMVKQSFRFSPQRKGAYYWRLASVDAEQLRGKYSDYITFVYNKNNSKPYLRVDHFNGKTTHDAHITVTGQSMPDFTVTVAKQAVEIDEKGYFSTDISLLPGKNTIKIEADNKSGQKSFITRELLYLPKEEPILFRSDETIYQRKNTILIHTVLDSAEQIILNNRVLSNGGLFYQSVPLENGPNVFVLNKQNGKQKKRTVIVDFTTPSLTYSFLPAIINKAQSIQLMSNEIVTFFVDEKPVGNGANVSFTPEYRLGEQIIQFKALDPAGNVAYANATVLFDDQKPQFERYKTSQTSTAFIIEIYASDLGSGLDQSCVLTASIDGEIQPVAAQLGRNGTYVATINKKTSTDQFQLVEIALQDRAKNSTHVKVDQ